MAQDTPVRRYVDLVLGATHVNARMAKYHLVKRMPEFKGAMTATIRSPHQLEGLRIGHVFVTSSAVGHEAYDQAMEIIHRNLALNAKDLGPVEGRIFLLWL